MEENKKKGKRLNVYVKKEHVDLIEEGKQNGISPSYALVAGYKSLINRNSQYKLELDKRERLLSELATCNFVIEELEKEVGIDPARKYEIAENLIGAYLRYGEIDQTVKDTNRVKLGMNVEEFDKFLFEKVISVCESGIRPNLDNNRTNTKNIDKLKTRAVDIFKRAYYENGLIEKDDIELWAERLNMDPDEFYIFLEAEGVHA